MTRALLGEFLFFLVPFIVFFIYLAIRQRNPLTFAAWEKSIPILVLIGAAFVAISLTYTGFRADRATGEYVPPRVEDGRVVPGYFR
jgi:TRAP-type mannitol/chloroaromatic compound transport system permease small subunit